MSIYTGNFRRAAVATAAAWTHAVEAIVHAQLVPSKTSAVKARRAAHIASLDSLDANKFSAAAYAEGDNSIRDVAASAYAARVIAMRAAEDAEAGAEKTA